MNAIDFQPWMEGAVAEVLESMCFISTEGEAVEAVEHYQPDWVCSSLRFKGIHNGTFGLAVPPATASTIASNFLGDDEDSLNEAQCAEVICEFANMVCGTLLAHLEPKKTFDLSPPQRHPYGGQGQPGEDRIARTFTLDEGSLYAWLTLQPAHD
jgi:CheY-specific phosphatase CheX